MPRIKAMKQLTAVAAARCLAGSGGALAKAPEPNAMNPSPSPSSASPVARPIGEFTDRHGFRRKYYVVPAGLSDAQLTELAQRLHATEKNAWLWLLDSDEKARQMMETVSKTQDGDLKNYPGQWVEKHTAAHSALEVLPHGKGRRWALFKGPYSGQMLTALPCLDKASLCNQ